VDGIWPAAVFRLDMPPTAADRRLARPLDRMERQGNEFRERLRAGFLAEAARQENRIYIVDADRPPETVQDEIRRIAKSYLATQARTDNPRLLTDTNSHNPYTARFHAHGILASNAALNWTARSHA